MIRAACLGLFAYFVGKLFCMIASSVLVGKFYRIAMLSLLLIVPLFSAPSWVPEEKREAFERIVQDAKRFVQILEADYTIQSCKIIEDYLEIYASRHDLIQRIEVYTGIKAEDCIVDNNRITIKFPDIKEISQCDFWCKTINVLKTAAVFAGGIVVGYLVRTIR